MRVSITFRPFKSGDYHCFESPVLAYCVEELSFCHGPRPNCERTANRGDVAARINQSLARLNRGGARSVAVVFVVAVNGVARATQSRGHVAAYVNQLVTGVNHFLASESWPRYRP